MAEEHRQRTSLGRDRMRARILELATKYGAALAAGDQERVKSVRQQIDALERDHYLGASPDDPEV